MLYGQNKQYMWMACNHKAHYYFIVYTEKLIQDSNHKPVTYLCHHQYMNFILNLDFQTHFPKLPLTLQTHSTDISLQYELNIAVWLLVCHPNPLEILSLQRSLSTTDILGQKILCFGGFPMHLGCLALTTAFFFSIHKMPVAPLPRNNIQEKGQYFIQLYAIVYCVQDKNNTFITRNLLFQKSNNKRKTLYCCNDILCMQHSYGYGYLINKLSFER